MNKEVVATLSTGYAGESIAQTKFTKTGWAPPTKLIQDIGDDFITFARSHVVQAADGTPTRVYDLSAPVFLQIKASATDYRQPSHEEDGQLGWWYDESDIDDFDHWLRFGLPYLLVLVDEDGEVAYWQQVAGKTIVSTGKGRKIFVPQEQRVDHDSLERLNALAVAARVNPLEGTAWDGLLESLPPSDHLRNALVVPRVVAPHPNRSPGPVTYEQAVALLVRNRAASLHHLAAEDHCPGPASWDTHSKWGWRFVGAIWEVLNGDAPTLLSGLSDKRRLVHERDAALVVHACWEYANGSAEDAVNRLKVAKNTRPADRGWILAQRAAFLLELGRKEEAAASAQEALIALAHHDGDLSVSAIRGGCAAVLFAASGFGSGDVATAIAAQDNAAAWWRAQDVGHALSLNLDDRFHEWSNDTSTRWARTDAVSELATSAWNAAFGSSWGGWRAHTVQRCKLVLTSTKDARQVSKALDALIYCGEANAVTLASRWLWQDGPVEGLASVVAEWAVDAWPLRSEGCAFRLFAEVADLLPSTTANRLVHRLIDTLRNEPPVRSFAGAADRTMEIPRALERTLVAAGVAAHRSAARLVADHLAAADDFHAQALVRVLVATDLSVIGTGTISDLVTSATTRKDPFGNAALETLAPHAVNALSELQRRSADDDLLATRSLVTLGHAEPGHWAAVGRRAAELVVAMVDEATPSKNGERGFAMRTTDPLHDLVVSAMQTGNTRHWSLVTKSLEARVLMSSSITSAVELMASHFGELPEAVQRRLARLAPSLSGVPDPMKSNGLPGARLALEIAAGLHTDSDVIGRLLTLKANDPLGFVRLLGFWRGPGVADFLTSLLVDPTPSVRRHAAYYLMAAVARGDVTEADADVAVAAALSVDQGCAMAAGLAQAFRDMSARGAAAEMASQHISAVVRSFGSSGS